MKQRVAVAISGGGRSLKNLLAQQSKYAYEIAGVLSSSPGCRGNSIAEEARLPLLVADFSDPATEGLVIRFLKEQACTWVALAGFIKKFPVLPDWRGRVVNIHPALLPAFGGKGMYGMRVHEAVLASGAQESGATLHFVNEHYDQGTVIAQAKVSTLGIARAQELADRVFAAECALFPRVMDSLVKGKLPLKSGVKIYEF